jgi:hypothetical protein
VVEGGVRHRLALLAAAATFVLLAIAAVLFAIARTLGTPAP